MSRKAKFLGQIVVLIYVTLTTNPGLSQTISGTNNSNKVMFNSSLSHEEWDDRFFLAGPSGAIRAFARQGSDIFVGGFFEASGNILASGIAKWDGLQWANLGAGVSQGEVLAILVDSNKVYVAGSFHVVDGQTVEGVALWDGSSWSALGDGTLQPFFGSVQSLAKIGNDIYAGGKFDGLGGFSGLNNIARWDGAMWQPLGTGVNDIIFDMAVDGSDLFVAGAFFLAGGSVTKRIAKWDGNSWMAFNPDPNIFVSNAIEVDGSNIYVGGNFSEEFGFLGNNVVMFDGNAWSRMGNGVNGIVEDIVVESGAVFVCGNFDSAGTGPADKVAVWNGSSWSSVGNGFGGGSARGLFNDGSDVIAVGSFFSANNAAFSQAAQWNGVSWSPVFPDNGGLGVFNEAESILIQAQDVYVGGFFGIAGNIRANNIAKWNGGNWEALGDGINGRVKALELFGNNLIAGGLFDIAGGGQAANISMWDGNSWTALGSGISGGSNAQVCALFSAGSDLYVAGLFSSAGGISSNNIAKWDGNNWSSLGSGTDGVVLALAGDGAYIYAGGTFTMAGGNAVSNIARWNGSSWSAMGTGVTGSPGTVRTLGFNDTLLHVGGDFQDAGGTFAADYALWDGSNWINTGNPGVSDVSDIAFQGDTVIVVGLAGAAIRPPGSFFQSLDIGSAKSVGANGPDLFFGGQFEIAGGNVAVGFTRYHFNQPPALANAIADQFVPEDFMTHVVADLGAVFSDPDDPVLFWAVSTDGNTTAQVNGSDLELSAVSDFSGMSEVIVVADDGALSVSDTFAVMVASINDPPSLSNVPDVTFDEDQNAQLALNQFVTDVDHDTSQIAFSADVIGASQVVQTDNTLLYDEAKRRLKKVFGRADVRKYWKDSKLFLEVDETDLIISIDSLTHVVDFSSSMDSSGTFTVVFTATDDSGAADNDTISVTVNPINDGPVVVNAVQDTVLNEDSGPHVFVADLKTVFSDADGDVMTFSSVSSAGMQVNISNDTLYGDSDLNFVGMAEVTVTADDGVAAASDSFLVTFLNVNDPPQATTLLHPAAGDTLPNITSPVDFRWTSANDIDGDPVSFNLILSGPGLDSAIISIVDTAFLFDGSAVFQATATYAWFVESTDGIVIVSSDTSEFHTPIVVDLGGVSGLPVAFALHQNYPNPFNPKTHIRFDLPATSRVTLRVFNSIGQEVRTLISARPTQAGFQSVTWDGRNQSGFSVSSGIYIYELRAGDFVRSRKMLLLK